MITSSIYLLYHNVVKAATVLHRNNIDFYIAAYININLDHVVIGYYFVPDLGASIITVTLSQVHISAQ